MQVLPGELVRELGEKLSPKEKGRNQGRNSIRQSPLEGSFNLTLQGSTLKHKLYLPTLSLFVARKLRLSHQYSAMAQSLNKLSPWSY